MSSRVGVIGITREIVMLIPSLRLEGEAQLGQHWGKQSHQELNALATTRWITFPWDEYVLTTAGFGFGLSYAFVPAPLEARPGRTPDQLLIYLLLDLEFALPRSPDHIIFFGYTTVPMDTVRLATLGRRTFLALAFARDFEPSVNSRLNKLGCVTRVIQRVKILGRLCVVVRR